MKEKKTYPIDKIVYPFQKMIHGEKSGGIMLAISFIIAIFLANSPWSEQYFSFFENTFGFQFNDKILLEYNLHHWINDGLMSIFFFVVGLELKREMVGGELSNPRKALIPIGAALGGMIVPASIYFLLNPVGEVHSGWGIPMATDIAFALAVLYLLGKRIPLALKVFLTALAIADDLGAVMVIAFFYNSHISLLSLGIGLSCVALMYAANRIGVRSILFYAVVGVFGVWIAFLLSGVHATIAAVLVAFTIPADMVIKEDKYIKKIQKYLSAFKEIDANDQIPVLMEDQLHILEEIKKDTRSIIPPLQRLEHALHPFITFVVLPVFALANAGVSLNIDLDQLFSTNVALGVFLGLLLGKVIGVMGATLIMVKIFKIAPFPTGMNIENLFGLSLLAAIGFTMSLFITSLAFSHEEYVVQAKIGIFTASFIGGILGYLVLSRDKKKQEKRAKN